MRAAAVVKSFIWDAGINNVWHHTMQPAVVIEATLRKTRIRPSSAASLTNAGSSSGGRCAGDQTEKRKVRPDECMASYEHGNHASPAGRAVCAEKRESGPQRSFQDAIALEYLNLKQAQIALFQDPGQRHGSGRSAFLCLTTTAAGPILS